MQNMKALTTAQLITFAENVMNPELAKAATPHLTEVRMATHRKCGNELLVEMNNRVNGPRKPRNLSTRMSLLHTLHELEDWLEENEE